jgi:NADPH-dependent ferric siderophore reductase
MSNSAIVDKEVIRQLMAFDIVQRRIVAGSRPHALTPVDKLVIGGPRGSLVVPEDYAWQLYVCDESGMPALRC